MHTLSRSLLGAVTVAWWWGEGTIEFAVYLRKRLGLMYQFYDSVHARCASLSKWLVQPGRPPGCQRKWPSRHSGRPMTQVRALDWLICTERGLQGTGITCQKERGKGKSHG